AQWNDVHVLRPHHAVGLWPAPVVADARADVGVHGAPHAEAEVARLEVTLLQVLEGAPGLVLGMAGKMDLAVAADDAPAPVDQDRGVEATHPGPRGVQLGEAQIEAEPQPLRLAEERRRLVRRHLALEEAVDLLLIGHPPAREEGGERELREDDEVAAVAGGLAHELDEPLDHACPAVRALDRPELRRADGQDACHLPPPSLTPPPPVRRRAGGRRRRGPPPPGAWPAYRPGISAPHRGSACGSGSPPAA